MAAGAQAIPAPRPGTQQELSHIEGLAATPGGLHFLGTTPGGTRIIYDRNTLMHYRNAPISKTPPVDFPVIPGVTCAIDTIAEGVEGEEGSDEEQPETPVAPGLGIQETQEDEDDTFVMD